MRKKYGRTGRRGVSGRWPTGAESRCVQVASGRDWMLNAPATEQRAAQVGPATAKPLRPVQALGGLFPHLALLLISGLAFAQDQGPARKLTWEEAVQMAARHSEIEAARAALAASRKSDEIARARLFPTLNLAALKSIGLPASSGATRIPGVVNSAFTKTPAAGADAAWTIWDFGRTLNAIQEARASQQAAQARVHMAEERVFLRLLSAFSRARLYAELEKITASRLKDVSVIKKEVTHYVSVGLRSPVDQHLMEALHLKVKGQLVELKGLAQAADADLKEAVSLQADEPLAVIFEPHQHSLLNNVEFVGLAGSMPEVREAQAEVERAAAARRGAQADRWPRLVGVGSVAWADGHRLGEDDDFSAGLGLRLPLFEGLRTAARIKQARHEEEAAKAQLDSTLELTRAQLQRLHALTTAAAEQRQLAEQEERAAKKAYRLGRKRYLTRRADLPEFREAEAGYHRAAERHIRADVTSWQQARLVELVIKMGTP